MAAHSEVYIVRTKDMKVNRIVNARSDRDAISKVTRIIGSNDYLAYRK
jgi:hypothetical protein